jgi:hypothetical protein
MLRPSQIVRQPPFLGVLVLLALSPATAAQVGTVASEKKISETSGGFGGLLDPADVFGASVTPLGDLNGDGNPDLAVGAYSDDDGDGQEGAVWILFLNADGTVASEQKISETSGGFGGVLGNRDYFGYSVTSLGDLDGDGNPDLAVGHPGDDDGGGDQGAVWILFLNADGTVASERKISETTGGFGGVLHSTDQFGISVAALGDLDGDGNQDLAVGAGRGDDGGTNQGAVWILFLNSDGTISSEQKISETAGGFGGALDPGDYFGYSVAALDDLDGNGTGDVAVGAKDDDDEGLNQGAIWILFLEEDASAPTLSCPPIISVIDSKSGPFGDLAFFTVTASDDHDPDPSVVCVPPSGSFFPRGTTIVTCTATDASGNQSVCTFPVVVMPTIRERRM